MAQIHYRANLRAAYPPSSFWKIGSTVIKPGIDQHYIPANAQSGSEADVNIGIPQVAYLRNVFPSREGYTAIGLASKDFNLLGSGEEIVSNVVTFSENIVAYVRKTTVGSLYIDIYIIGHTIYTISTNLVTEFGVAIDNIEALTLSMAAAGDRLWVMASCRDKTNDNIHSVLFQGRKSVSLFQKVTTLPAEIAHWDPNAHAGKTIYSPFTIVGAGGRVLIGRGDTIYKSDIVSNLPDPSGISWATDPVTGAGQETLEEITAEIKYMLPTSGGFVVYTIREAVLAKETGDIVTPYFYRLIEGVGGLAKADRRTPVYTTSYKYEKDEYVLPAFDPVTKLHFILDEEGPKLLSGSEYITIPPRLSEYYTGFINVPIEDWIQQDYVFKTYGGIFTTEHEGNKVTVSDESRGVFTESIKNRYYKRIDGISAFGGNYIGVSVSIYNKDNNGNDTNLITRTIIYDINLKRVGDLTIDGIRDPNTDQFSYKYIPIIGVSLYGERLFIFGKTHTVYGRLTNWIPETTVKTDYTSLLILGRYQYIRGHRITLHKVEVEDAFSEMLLRHTGAQNQDLIWPTEASISIIPSYDGVNLAKQISPRQEIREGHLYETFFRDTCKNFMIALKGPFDISSLQLIFTDSGRR